MQKQVSVWLTALLTVALLFQGSAVWNGSGSTLGSAEEEQKDIGEEVIVSTDTEQMERGNEDQEDRAAESVYLKDFKVSKGSFSQNRSVSRELDVLTEVKVGEERTAVQEEMKPEGKLSSGLKKAIRDLRPGTEVEILISVHWDYWDNTDMVIRSIKDVVGENMVYEKVKFSGMQIKADISCVSKIAELKTVSFMMLPKENIEISIPEFDSESEIEEDIRNNGVRTNSSSEMLGVKKARTDSGAARPNKEVAPFFKFL